MQAKEHLTAHELELLTRKELDRRLARIRDVFVFCCLTGLAFADADHLRREHLSQDDEGRWWIHKPREKTSVMSRTAAPGHARNPAPLRARRSMRRTLTGAPYAE